MKTQDAVDHFGGVRQLAEALGIRRQAIYNWGKRVPKLRAFELERLTRGKLRVDGRAA